MEHHFSPEVAKVVGIQAAVLFYNISHWCEKNEANNKHFHDGSYWTYNSIKAFQAQFPYMSLKQIENSLNKLKETELIKTGNYNELQRDRTLWYTVTEKGKCISSKGEMQSPKKGNAFPQKGEPLPYNKHTDNNNISSNEDIYVGQTEKIDYEQIKNDFNSICSSLPKVKDITDARKKVIKSLHKSLIKLNDFKGKDLYECLRTIFQEVQSSEFLSGRSGSWNGCSFDWILKKSNALKILEGNYKNKDTPKVQQKPQHKPQSNNKFNNFPQRDYSQDQQNTLEQKLLERAWGL